MLQVEQNDSKTIVSISQPQCSISSTRFCYVLTNLMTVLLTVPAS